MYRVTKFKPKASSEEKGTRREGVPSTSFSPIFSNSEGTILLPEASGSAAVAFFFFAGKRVARNIRNIREPAVGRHPVDYFENIITKGVEKGARGGSDRKMRFKRREKGRTRRVSAFSAFCFPTGQRVFFIRRFCARLSVRPSLVITAFAGYERAMTGQVLGNDFG